jgi:inositol-pentakisphosphate 2-kinase
MESAYSRDTEKFASCVDVLRSNSLELSLIAEGNANVVLAVSPTDPALTAYANRCVLRLRKDLSFTRPALEIFGAFRTRIAPLYALHHEDVLLEQALLPLNESLLTQAQGILRTLERDESPNRPVKRRGVYLPSLEAEPHGVIMPNLHYGTDTKLLEFKPKWLLPSPSAPNNALRCRTCALNGMRKAQGKVPGRGDAGFCPLKLLAREENVLKEALQRLNPTSSAIFLRDFIDKVQPALRFHQRLQLQYPRVGLEDFLAPDESKELDLALRDCSFFLVVEVETSYIKDIKFADLDLKTPNAEKLVRWANIERSLLDSGAYLTADDICVLSDRARAQSAPQG